jgi:hypothetical protein
MSDELAVPVDDVRSKTFRSVFGEWTMCECYSGKLCRSVIREDCSWIAASAPMLWMILLGGARVIIAEGSRILRVVSALLVGPT